MKLYGWVFIFIFVTLEIPSASDHSDSSLCEEDSGNEGRPISMPNVAPNSNTLDINETESVAGSEGEEDDGEEEQDYSTEEEAAKTDRISDQNEGRQESGEPVDIVFFIASKLKSCRRHYNKLGSNQPRKELREILSLPICTSKCQMAFSWS